MMISPIPFRPTTLDSVAENAELHHGSTTFLPPKTTYESRHHPLLDFSASLRQEESTIILPSPRPLSNTTNRKRKIAGWRNSNTRKSVPLHYISLNEEEEESRQYDDESSSGKPIHHIGVPGLSKKLNEMMRSEGEERASSTHPLLLNPMPPKSPTHPLLMDPMPESPTHPLLMDPMPKSSRANRDRRNHRKKKQQGKHKRSPAQVDFDILLGSL